MSSLSDRPWELGRNRRERIQDECTDSYSKEKEPPRSGLMFLPKHDDLDDFVLGGTSTTPSPIVSDYVILRHCKLMNAMVEAAHMPPQEIITEDTLSNPSLSGLSRYYEDLRFDEAGIKTKDQRRILDAMIKFALSSPYPCVPPATISVPLSSLDELLMHLDAGGYALDHQQEEDVYAFIVSGVRSREKRRLTYPPFVKFLCFFKELIKPFIEFASTVYQKLGREAARELVQEAVEQIPEYIENNGPSGVQDIVLPRLEKVIGNLIMPVGKIDRSLVFPFTKEAVREFEYFSRIASIERGKADKKIDEREENPFAQFLRLLKEMYSAGPGIANMVARDARRYLRLIEDKKAASEDFLNYKRILTRTVAKDPGLGEDILLNIPIMGDGEYGHPFLVSLEKQATIEVLIDTYIDARRRLDPDGTKRENLVRLLRDVNKMRHSLRYTNIARDTIREMNDPSVFERWLGCADAIRALQPGKERIKAIMSIKDGIESTGGEYTHSPEWRLEIFLQYNFKSLDEHRKREAFLDEFQMLSIALGQGRVSSIIGRNDAYYHTPATYAIRNQQTSGAFHRLRRMIKLVHSLSEAFCPKTLGEDKDLHEEVEQALRQIEQKYGLLIEGQKDMRVCVPKRKDLEQRVSEQNPEIRKSIGDNEVRVLAATDFTNLFLLKDSYPFFRKLRESANTWQESYDEKLDRFLEMEGVGILNEMIKFFDTQLPNQLPRLQYELNNILDDIFPKYVKHVRVGTIDLPEEIIMNGIDACVFQNVGTERQPQEEGDEESDKEHTQQRTCFESALSYACDPHTRIVLLEAYGDIWKTDDFVSGIEFAASNKVGDMAAALVLHTLSRDNEHVLLVDGVMANKDVKNLRTPEGKDWREVLLRGILGFASRNYATKGNYATKDMAFNTSHKNSEKYAANQFVRYVAERVFGYAHGTDFFFNEEYGYVFRDEDLRLLPLETGRAIWLRKEQMCVEEGRETVEDLEPASLFDGRGFYHSWYLHNLNAGHTEHPFWTRGEGRVRALVLRNFREFYEKAFK